ncbi:MAG TPA: hypothetical protein VIW95_00845 [Candidatus Binatus sp.]|uniref:hypothetical protein n=1 Tax=Candidatus Binatus sp. TaxID=2811406 RepID=UPI002F3FE733
MTFRFSGGGWATGRSMLAVGGGKATAAKMRALGFPNLVKAREALRRKADRATTRTPEQQRGTATHAGRARACGLVYTGH